MASLPGSPQHLVPAFGAATSLQALSPVPSVQMCPICLDPLTSGVARVTLACNHTYHVDCINGAAANAHMNCPMCRGPVAHLQPATIGFDQSHTVSRVIAPDAYALDATLEVQTNNTTSTATSMTIEVVCQNETESGEENRFGLATLTAGEISSNLSADIVLLLDVSGSMMGPKLQTMKRTVHAIAAELRSGDRIGILAFDDNVKCVSQLTSSYQPSTVDELVANGGTDMKRALQHAEAMLTQRRQKNPISAIIFLSDGVDSCNASFTSTSMASVRAVASWVNVIGLGADHDARALSDIAEHGGGTFAYVANVDGLPAAVGAAVGTLTSVCATDVRIEVLNEQLNVGVMCAGEVKRLLFEVADGAVPRARVLFTDTNGVHHDEIHNVKDGVTEDDLTAIYLERARTLVKHAINGARASAERAFYAAAIGALETAKAKIGLMPRVRDTAVGRALLASIAAAEASCADARAFVTHNGLAAMRSAGAAFNSQRYAGGTNTAPLQALFSTPSARVTEARVSQNAQ